MDALPGWPSERIDDASPPRAWWRARGRPRAQGLGAALVLVLALGALQGARAALGPALLERPRRADPPTSASPPPSREADWRRGSFYRPAGSTASRPRLLLRPLAWRPAPRVARTCSGGADRSC